ncbi:hypothetical protein [Leeia aquatica]|uniref:Uncharacterized protein n=1 Tax=Leeia aquatica TaxID=2725557 RepID=A0A847SBJ8_9NEIS|nr:hypothetical protein [Leeia aquatica]NLR74478.1 hypothetical protein [Leeia aquatica]
MSHSPSLRFTRWPWLRPALLCALLLYAIVAAIRMIRQDSCWLQLGARMGGHPSWAGMAVSALLELLHFALLGLLGYRLYRGHLPSALEYGHPLLKRALRGKSLALALLLTLMATEPFGFAATGLEQAAWQVLGLQSHECAWW